MAVAIISKSCELNLRKFVTFFPHKCIFHIHTYKPFHLFICVFWFVYWQQAATTLQRLFVYGTLKSGEPSHQILKDSTNGLAKYWCKATTTVKMPLVIGTRYNIPFLINKPGIGSYVTGEIYEVDEQMMDILDNLEDCQRLYKRAVQPMNMGIGEG